MLSYHVASKNNSGFQIFCRFSLGYLISWQGLRTLCGTTWSQLQGGSAVALLGCTASLLPQEFAPRPSPLASRLGFLVEQDFDYHKPCAPTHPAMWSFGHLEGRRHEPGLGDTQPAAALARRAGPAQHSKASARRSRSKVPARRSVPCRQPCFNFIYLFFYK